MASGYSTINNNFIFTLNDDEFEHSVNDMKAYFNKFTTKQDKIDYLGKLEQCIKEYNHEIDTIKDYMDKLKQTNKKLDNMKIQIIEYIEEQFNNITIMMIHPKIPVCIDVFSNEQLKELLDLKIITIDIYENEIEWRKIKEEYPTFEDKLKYIQLIEEKMSINISKIKSHLDNIHRINMLKNKVELTKNSQKYYEEFNNLNNIYIYNFEQSELNELTKQLESAKPIEPTKPTEPVEQLEPTKPTEPVEQLEPIKPAELFLPLLTEKTLVESISSDDEEYDDYKIAPDDVWLEDFCRYNNYCRNINEPTKCSFNHVEYNTYPSRLIKKGERLPPNLCEREAPWINKLLRCRDLYCNKLHCGGRVKFIKEQLELKMFSKRKYEEDENTEEYSKRRKYDFTDLRNLLNNKKN
jgi:hypothetical protein